MMDSIAYSGERDVREITEATLLHYPGFTLKILNQFVADNDKDPDVICYGVQI